MTDKTDMAYGLIIHNLNKALSRAKNDPTEAERLLLIYCRTNTALQGALMRHAISQLTTKR